MKSFRHYSSLFVVFLMVCLLNTPSFRPSFFCLPPSSLFCNDANSVLPKSETLTNEPDTANITLESQLQNAISQIEERINKRSKNENEVPFVTLVDGISCSGKTTQVSKRIQAYFADKGYAVKIFNQDNYYRDEAYMKSQGIVNWDTPAALDLDLFLQHVRLLKEGKAIDEPIYSFAECKRVGYKKVSPAQIMIIEGLFILDGQIAHEGDFNVLVKVDTLGQLLRRIDRDVLKGRSSRTFQQAVTQLYQQVVPAEKVYIGAKNQNAMIKINNEFLVDKETPDLLKVTNSLLLEDKTADLPKYDVQLKVPLVGDISVKLREMGAREIKVNKQQVDTYYTPNDKNILATDEIFKIRKEGKEFKAFYKGPKLNYAGLNYRISLPIALEESVIADLENYYHPIGRISKTRSTFELGNLLIHLDNVEGLGNFIEIKGQNLDDKEEINSLLNKLDLKDSPLSDSYLTIANSVETIFQKFASSEVLKKLRELSFLKDLSAENLTKQVHDNFLEKYSDFMRAIVKLDHEAGYEFSKVDESNVKVHTGHSLDVLVGALQLRNLSIDKCNLSNSLLRIEDFYTKDPKVATEVIADLKQRIESLVPGDIDKAYEILYITTFLHDIGKFRDYAMHEKAGEEIIVTNKLLEGLIVKGQITKEQAGLILLGVRYHILLGLLWGGEFPLTELTAFIKDPAVVAFLDDGQGSFSTTKLEQILNLVYPFTTCDIAGASPTGGFLMLKKAQWQRQKVEQIVALATKIQTSAEDIEFLAEKVGQIAFDPAEINARAGRALIYYYKEIDKDNIDKYSDLFAKTLKRVMEADEVAVDALELINTSLPNTVIKGMPIVVPGLGWAPFAAASYSKFYAKDAFLHDNMLHIPEGQQLNSTAVKVLALLLKIKQLAGDKGNLFILPEPMEIFKTPDFQKALWSLELNMRLAYDVKRQGNEYFLVDKQGQRVLLPEAPCSIEVKENGDIVFAFKKFESTKVIRMQSEIIQEAA